METTSKKISKRKLSHVPHEFVLYRNMNFKNASQSTVSEMEMRKKLREQQKDQLNRQRPDSITEESSTNMDEISQKTNGSEESLLELLNLPVKKNSERLLPNYSEKQTTSECSITTTSKTDDDHGKMQRSKSCIIGGFSIDSSSSIRRSPSMNMIDSESMNNSNVKGSALLSFKIEEQRLKDMGYDSKIIPNWNKKKQLTKSDLYALLRVMIEGHLNPNVLVCTSTTNFHCHLMVLQCYSKFFREFSNEYIIVLPDNKVTAKGFEAVYKWMTTENANTDRENILEMYRTATFLGIDELICQCWHLIGDDEIFVEDAAFLLYIEAGTYDMLEVKELLLPRVHKFFLTAVASFDFLCLDVDDIIKLLSSNSIGVNSEMEVFFTAVRWLDYKWPARKCYCLKLMNCIRFNLMPPWFLVTLQKQKMEMEVNHVITNPNVKKLIDEGLMYATSLLQFGGREEDLEMFLKDLNLERPVQRSWIFDPNCVYHHNINCPTGGFLKYELFLAYLSHLKNKNPPGDWRNLKTATSDINRCCNLSVPSKTGKHKRNKVGTYCSLKCSSWCLSSSGEIHPFKPEVKEDSVADWSSEELEEQSCIPIVTMFDGQREKRNPTTKCVKNHAKEDYPSDKELERMKYNNALLVKPDSQKDCTDQGPEIDHGPTKSNNEQLGRKPFTEFIQNESKREKKYQHKQHKKPKQKREQNFAAEEEDREKRKKHCKISKSVANKKLEEKTEGETKKPNLEEKCKKVKDSSHEEQEEKDKKKRIPTPKKTQSKEIIFEKPAKDKPKLIKAPSSEESEEKIQVSEPNLVTIKSSLNLAELVKKKNSMKKMQEIKTSFEEHFRVKDTFGEQLPQISEELCAKNCGPYKIILEPIKNIKPIEVRSSVENRSCSLDINQKVLLEDNEECTLFELKEKLNQVECELVNISQNRRQDGGNEQDKRDEIRRQRFLEKRLEELREERSFFRKRNAGLLAVDEEDEEKDDTTDEEDEDSSEVLTDTNCADFIKRLDGIKHKIQLTPSKQIKPIHVKHCPSGYERNSKTLLDRRSCESKGKPMVENIHQQPCVSGKHNKQPTYNIQHTLKQKQDSELPSLESVECFKKLSQKLMVFGGQDPSDDTRYDKNIVLYYDNVNKKWKCLTHMPFPPRQHFCAVECLGTVYILGGTYMKGDIEFIEKNVYKFDTQSLKWSLETEMPDQRKDFAVVPIVGISQICQRNICEHGIYVIGGQDSKGNILDSVWYYDIKRQSWLQKCKLNTARYGLTAVLVNNEIVAAGGVTCLKTVCCRDVPDNPQNRTHLVITNSVEVYRLNFEPYRGCECSALFNYSGERDRMCSLDKWTTCNTRLRLPRLYGKFCLSSNGHLYIGGGICKQYENSYKPLGCIDCYDFRTKEWFQACNMDYNRHGHDMVEYMNALVIIGGVTGDFGNECRALRDVFMYNIRKDSKENLITQLPWPISGAVAIVLR